MYSNQDQKTVLHQGVYKYQTNVVDAIFMITGMTIGAGILGLPYVISQAGLLMGMFYIVAFGLVMLFLNLMLGEIAVRTNGELQLAGFAGKYLGKWAKGIIATTIIFSSYGVLLAYIIGEGETMAALFGGQSAFWSVIFWVFGSVMIWFGLQTV